MQNFAESPLRAPEKIFAVFIFAAPVRTGKRGAIDIALAAIFAVLIFTEADLSAKTAKFLHHAKTSRYTVYSIVYFLSFAVVFTPIVIPVSYILWSFTCMHEGRPKVYGEDTLYS